MADTPPLICLPVLGSLRPANRAAEDAIKACSGPVVIKITKATRNQRRRAYYWVLLDVAAEVLQAKTDSPWDADSLHDTLKVRLRLGTPLKNSKGEEIGFKKRSTSDAKMTEPERAHWLDRVSNALSQWTGVPAEDLMREARERHNLIDREAA